MKRPRLLIIASAAVRRYGKIKRLSGKELIADEDQYSKQNDPQPDAVADQFLFHRQKRLVFHLLHLFGDFDFIIHGRLLFDESWSFSAVSGSRPVRPAGG
jgi:hypothetical protein